MQNTTGFFLILGADLRVISDVFIVYVFVFVFVFGVRAMKTECEHKHQ